MKSKIGYLNFILTVIALALTVIILQNAHLVPVAEASYSGKLPLNEKGEMLVRVANSEMDVVITGISSGCCYNELPVTVENTVDVEVQ